MDANLQNVCCLYSSAIVMDILDHSHCRPARVGISDRRLKFAPLPNGEWLSMGEQWCYIRSGADKVDATTPGGQVTFLPVIFLHVYFALTAFFGI